MATGTPECNADVSGQGRLLGSDSSMDTKLKHLLAARSRRVEELKSYPKAVASDAAQLREYFPEHPRVPNPVSCTSGRLNQAAFRVGHWRASVGVR